jgi:hypothetical protein
MLAVESLAELAKRTQSHLLRGLGHWGMAIDRNCPQHVVFVIILVAVMNPRGLASSHRNQGSAVFTCWLVNKKQKYDNFFWWFQHFSSQMSRILQVVYKAKLGSADVCYWGRPECKMLLERSKGCGCRLLCFCCCSCVSAMIQDNDDSWEPFFLLLCPFCCW